MTSRADTRARPRVLLVCSGLDHARRGYESFARECFEALRDDPGVHIALVKGSGASERDQHVAPTFRRDRSVALTLGRAFRVRPFRLEAAAFGLGLQPLLARAKADVVYLSEWDTALVLARLRPIIRRRFRLLLCNGGFASQGFDHLDHVQELTPSALEYVLARGADPERHSLLPLGFHIAPRITLPSENERTTLRNRLRLPLDRPVVLSVAALNRSHKRLDYLIDELASLPSPRPFLVLAGEPDQETPEIRALARARLGDGGFSMRTVAAEQVSELYWSSDLFVLASLSEMQGRAVIEAASHGLPCLAHNSPVMRFALGEQGAFADLSEPGALSRLLRDQMAMGRDAARRRRELAHGHVYERFSWDSLRPRYVELFRRVASANSTVSSSTGEKLPR